MAHYDPKTIEERRAVAGECETALQYGIRTYVDEMDDFVNDSYAAWPTRLYLIGLDGKVEYAGGLGPYRFQAGETESSDRPVSGWIEPRIELDPESIQQTKILFCIERWPERDFLILQASQLSYFV